MKWHYVDQGQQAGPVDDAQFAELVRTGKIQPDTLVWREDMPDWRPYREINTPPTQPGEEAVCIECGKIFPIGETIRYGNGRVCASCKPAFLQKLSEGAQINTGELRYAPILTRFAAAFLDGLILMAVNFAISFISGLVVAASARGGSSSALAPVLPFILLAVNMTIAVCYEGIMVGKYGATLGKMACKIKVVTADGGRVSYGRAIGRYFAKLLSSLICLIGYIMACFDQPQKRALHDHICNTRVVLK
jgi:uncharacterized RDD family membrane protein YckC